MLMSFNAVLSGNVRPPMCRQARVIASRLKSSMTFVESSPVTDREGLDVQETKDSTVLDFLVDSFQTRFLSPG